VPLRQLWPVTKAAASRQYEAEQAEAQRSATERRNALAAEVERADALVAMLGVGSVENRYSGPVPYIRLTLDQAATLTNIITKENQPS